VNAAGLEAALHAVGIDCVVEAQGGLAVLVPRAGVAATMVEPATRRDIAALALAHGFTHAALELTDDAGDGAALRRHQST
jgi:hypothetical protein